MQIPLPLDHLKCSRALSEVSVCATLQKRVTDLSRLRYRLRTLHCRTSTDLDYSTVYRRHREVTEVLNMWMCQLLHTSSVRL